MAKKAEPPIDMVDEKTKQDNIKSTVKAKDTTKDEISNLTRMLAAVLDYLSDEEVEEIDIEYLFNHTEGLREWWDKYRERNKKRIEEEIKSSLGELSLEELEKIREQIRKQKE